MILGHELEEWEIRLLIATVIAENFRGTTPDSWLAATAWAILNRLSKGLYDTLWKAVAGQQSAFRCWYQICGGVAPAYPGALDGDSTVSEIIDFVNMIYETHKSAWSSVDTLVRQAYSDWLNSGTGSSFDPTGGATDFRHKTVDSGVPGTDYDTAIEHYPTRTGTAYPGYFWDYLGPFTQGGTTYYMFFDNFSESQRTCYQQPACAALWVKK